MGLDNGVHVRGSARTSTGQVRENNEDSLHLWLDVRVALAVVADGMGGAAAGEEASRIAVEAVGEVFQVGEESTVALTQYAEMPHDQIVERLCDSVRFANLNIVRKASRNPELRGMGTTITAAYLLPGIVLVAHVGDSRAYAIDGLTRRITQITADHSFVEALVAAGHLTPAQAEEHPMRNVLYRALGQHEMVDIDVYESPWRPGDRLVLCSDGLTRHVKADEIARVVTEWGDPEIAAQSLIDLANKRGGEDNISVIVLSLTRGDGDDLSTLLLPRTAPLGSNPLHPDTRETLEFFSDDDDTQEMPRLR